MMLLELENGSAHGQGGREVQQSSNSEAHSSRFAGTTNPRHLRVLQAMLNGPQPRQTLDAVAGSTNVPELIAELRRRGLDAPCRRISAIDRDGKPCKPGVYSLTDSDRRKVNRWLAQRAAGSVSNDVPCS
jgi:hypothetical protein